jgi:hypothetical protein
MSKFLSTVVLLVACCYPALAQPLPPDPVVAAPLDGVTFLLIAGGAAAAATQLRNKEK